VNHISTTFVESDGEQKAIGMSASKLSISKVVEGWSIQNNQVKLAPKSLD
jgi:hypothetical protein